MILDKKTFIDFILPVARRFYSPQRGGMGTIMNLITPVLDQPLYVSTMIGGIVLLRTKTALTMQYLAVHVLIKYLEKLVRGR